MNTEPERKVASHLPLSTAEPGAHDDNSQLPLLIGLVLFPGLTQLDLTGPYEVFSRIPGARVRLVAESMVPVRSEWGMMFVPEATFADVGPLDILCVPGGWGVNAQLENATLMTFLREQAAHARFVTSVCSGALLLGAAGLLRGYQATTHWMSHDLLSHFGAVPVDARVVIDRNRITGGGVTAGIDFGLTVAAELLGADAAQQIQLAIEYQPSPPFASGHPDSAPAHVRDTVLHNASRALAERRRIVERVAAHNS